MGTSWRGLLFIRSALSNSLWPHGLQHTRLPPVLHYLPSFTQTHVHWVGDAIQPSHPLSSPSPPTLNLSQHQGLFRLVTYFHQRDVALFSPALSLSQHQGLFRWVTYFHQRDVALFSPVLSLSSIRVFSSESPLHTRGSKDWSFSISPSNEYSASISFRMDFFDLLAVQGSLNWGVSTLNSQNRGKIRRNINHHPSW